MPGVEPDFDRWRNLFKRGASNCLLRRLQSARLNLLDHGGFGRETLNENPRSSDLEFSQVLFKTAVVLSFVHPKD
jgi:hypothetical protein